MNATVLSFEGVDWEFSSGQGLDRPGNPSPHLLSGELVKQTPKRRVVRCEGVYVKEVRYRGVASLLKTAVGGTASREGRISLELARRGVANPEVLAYGSERRNGLLRRDVLLTREVEGGASLLDFRRKVFAALPARDRFRMVRDLAAFIRGLHDKGVLHTDLHVGNILVVPEGETWHFVLLDTDRVRLHPGPLDRKARTENLGQLLSNLWRSTSRSQRFRFLRGYGVSKEEGRLWLTAIGRSALKASRRVWNGKAQRSLHTNSRFVRELRGGFRVFRLRCPQSDALLTALLPDPDKILEEGRVIKAGRTTRVARVEVDGTSYFLKRYNCKGWTYRLRNAFRRSRAVQAWLVTWGFAVRGLPVPRPLLCMEERHFGLLGRSYVLTAFVEDARPFSLSWKGMNMERRRSMLICLAVLLGTMHRFGCLHGDLKWNNILLRQNDSVFLTDLDGSRISRYPTHQRRRKDIDRFMRDLGSEEKTHELVELFQRCWLRWSGRF